MTKKLPAPVEMARQVLENLSNHPDFEILKKKLPAFALQYAAKQKLTFKTLSNIAAKGVDALTIEQNGKKTEKTYQSIVKKLPQKEEVTPQEAQERINILDITKEKFYPSLTPYVMHFITAWEQQDCNAMQNALHSLGTAIEPCNSKIMEMEGAYDFYKLSPERLLREVEENSISVLSHLRQYAANGDLDYLKLFHNVVPNMRVPYITIPEAAYNTQMKVLDYYLKELEYKYPMMEDDYYSEDYIIQKVLEQENLETFKYLIDHGYSSDSYIYAKEALANPDFFDYGFNYMHKTDRPSGNYLRNVIARGTFDQVKQIIEAGRYLANGDAKDKNDNDYYSQINPIPYALYEAKDTELFTYLREHNSEDLDQEEIKHSMRMLMLNGDYKIADFLYETYPDAFTTDFINEEFRSVSSNFLNNNSEKNKQKFIESAPCYFLKKFGEMLDKSVLDEVISIYTYFSKESVLEEALSFYPYDTQDIWDRIISNIDNNPSFAHIERLQACDIGDIPNNTYLSLRSEISSYNMRKAKISTVVKIMDHTIPVATATEWQDRIKQLCSYHVPIFDEVIKHLETHPLKGNIFTTDFAKDLVVRGTGKNEYRDENEYGEFTLVDKVTKLCPDICDDELMNHAQNDIETDKTEKFIENRQAKNNWDKQHPGSPNSLLHFSPFFHQPKTFAPLVKIFEKEEGLDTKTAEKYAYQTAGLFGSMSRVMTYLEKWGHATKQPLHDIVHSLKLPKKGRFDKAAWADAVIKHGPKMAEMVHFANRMPQPKKSSDGKTWSYQETFKYTAEFAYENSAKAPELAQLCHTLRMGEDSFENALKIVDKFNGLSQKKGKAPNQNIPKIEIDGTDFGKEGYQFKRLETGDLRGLFLGAMTGCCQWIGGMGSDCAKHGFQSSNGGFYVISNSEDQIISQAWAWRGRKGEIVLDSIETLGTHVGQNEWQSICNKMASDFANNHKDITALHIGTGGQTPNLDYAETKAAKPIDKLGYSDANKQVIVWKRPCQAYIKK